jgi:HAE1 family hydrophobic/amphiphilic exporter-1
LANRGLVALVAFVILLVPTLYAMVEGRKERRRLKREAKRASATPEPTAEDYRGSHERVDEVPVS